jgi:hypothetical protein
MGRMVLLGILTVGLVSVAHATGETTHSGHLVAIGPGGHVVTVEEMGPWEGHHQVVHTLMIRLTPATTIETVARATEPKPRAWIGAFQETPASVATLRPGQYVTVRTNRVAAHQLVAHSIEIVGTKS